MPSTGPGGRSGKYLGTGGAGDCQTGMEQDCFSLTIITFELQFLTIGKFGGIDKSSKMKCPTDRMPVIALTETFT